MASGEVILGDGSYIMTLEKRGYATAGSWTPEAAAEHPEAIEQVVGMETVLFQDGTFPSSELSLQELALISPRRSPSGLTTMPFPKAASLR